MQLISSETHFDFVRQSRLFSIVSIVLVASSILAMIVIGPRWGVEYVGGTQIQVGVPAEAGVVDEAPLRAALEIVGVSGSVQRYGDPGENLFLIKLAVPLQGNEKLAEQVISAVDSALGTSVEMRAVDSVGPSVGAELRNASIMALLISWALILAYVWFRFDLRYAPGAVAALIHDVLITAGIFVVLGIEFDQNVVAALLVVIGYSLNDTIVIYDRIRENLEVRGTVELDDVVNQSVNQTLSRTLLTSGTTLLVVLSLLFLGGPALRDFAFALLIGVSIGTYSTIYVASALLIALEKRWGGVRKA